MEDVNACPKQPNTESNISAEKKKEIHPFFVELNEVDWPKIAQEIKISIRITHL